MLYTVGADTVLGVDRRFRHWAKLIRPGADVDLGRTNGYALSGPFVDWGKTVSLDEGTIIVLASETGSAKYHDYNYEVLSVVGDELVRHTETAIRDAVQGSSLPENTRAKAANNTLYMIAAWASLQFAPVAAALVPNPVIAAFTAASEADRAAFIRWLELQTVPA